MRAQDDDEDGATDEGGDHAQGDLPGVGAGEADGADHDIGTDHHHCAAQGCAHDEAGVTWSRHHPHQVRAHKTHEANRAGKNDGARREYSRDDELGRSEAAQVNADTNSLVVAEGGLVHLARDVPGDRHADTGHNRDVLDLVPPCVLTERADEEAAGCGALVREHVLEERDARPAHEADDHTHQDQRERFDEAASLTDHIDESKRPAGAQDRGTAGSEAAGIGEACGRQECPIDRAHHSQPRAAGEAKQVGRRERVAEEALEQHAGDGKGNANHGGGRDALLAHIQDHLAFDAITHAAHGQTNPDEEAQNDEEPDSQLKRRKQPPARAGGGAFGLAGGRHDTHSLASVRWSCTDGRTGKTPCRDLPWRPSFIGHERPFPEVALAQNSFRCKVVTPAAALVDEAVAYASVPLHDGLMGFLPGRAPLLARLGLGELRLDIADTGKGPGGTRSFAVSGGFVKMGDGQLTILAEKAIAGEELSASDADAEVNKLASATSKDATPAAADALREQRDFARLKATMARGHKGI